MSSPVVVLFLLLEASQAGAAPLTEREHAAYHSAASSRDRMEILQRVVERYQQTFRNMDEQGRTDEMVVVMSGYRQALDMVERDARALEPQEARRARSLRRLEIALRRTADELADFKKNAWWELHEAFDRSIDRTGVVRTTLLGVMLGSDILKER